MSTIYICFRNTKSCDCSYSTLRNNCSVNLFRGFLNRYTKRYLFFKFSPFISSKFEFELKMNYPKFSNTQYVVSTYTNYVFLKILIIYLFAEHCITQLYELEMYNIDYSDHTRDYII